MAFDNYLNQIDDLTEMLEFPILKNKITFEQTLPLSLNVSKFDSDLLAAPRIMKDFIHQYKHKKLMMKGIITWMEIHLTKLSFLTISEWMFFLFATAIISLLVTT